MFRIFITYVVPFLLPLAVYLAWARYRARYVEDHAGQVPLLERGPWALLLFLGAILALLSLGATTLLHESGPDTVYTPPHLKDGEIVPGHAEPRQR